MQGRRLTTVALAGVAAVAPLGLMLFAFILMQFVPVDRFGAYTRWSLIATAIIVVAFIFYSVLSPAVPGYHKVFLPGILLLGNIVLLPLFWFFYIWRAARRERSI